GLLLAFLGFIVEDIGYKFLGFDDTESVRHAEERNRLKVPTHFEQVAIDSKSRSNTGQGGGHARDREPRPSAGAALGTQRSRSLSPTAPGPQGDSHRRVWSPAG